MGAKHAQAALPCQTFFSSHLLHFLHLCWGQMARAPRQQKRPKLSSARLAGWPPSRPFHTLARN